MRGSAYMKKKFMAFFLLSFLAFGSVTAFAKTIQFEIYRSDGVVWVASNTKDLSGSKRIYLFDTSSSNFIEDEDVIGFRVKNPAGTVSYSDYHRFSRFVDEYPLSYITTPTKGASLRLNSQIDSKGKYDYIKFDGEWIA
jgi:hypothetical protein